MCGVNDLVVIIDQPCFSTCFFFELFIEIHLTPMKMALTCFTFLSVDQGLLTWQQSFLTEGCHNAGYFT